MAPPLLLQACLQVFQALPKDVAPLVWSTSGKSETLQSLLGLLLEVVWGKVRTALGRDGVAYPKEQSSAVLPTPLLRQACRDSPMSGMSERPHVAACRGS